LVTLSSKNTITIVLSPTILCSNSFYKIYYTHQIWLNPINIKSIYFPLIIIGKVYSIFLTWNGLNINNLYYFQNYIMMLIKTLQNQIKKIDSKSYLVQNFQYHNRRATSTHVCHIINWIWRFLVKKKLKIQYMLHFPLQPFHSLNGFLENFNIFTNNSNNVKGTKILQ